MRIIFSAILLFIALSTCAQVGVKDEDWSKVKNQNFDALLMDLNIHFLIPKGFSETALVENKKVLYHKAYSHGFSGFEFRIWIRDLRVQKTIGGLTSDQFSKSFITMLSLNASGYILPDIPEITIFDKDTSSSEFNADWVASTVFLTKSNSFNKGYEIGSILGMRKKDIAEVYVFYMISDKKKETYLIKDLIQVVKFQ